MSRLRLGQVEWIGCFPIYYALEKLLPLEAELVKGSPEELNKLLLTRKLTASPISSIEYARFTNQYIIIPDISISADGQVTNILFFSFVPVTELEGKKICISKNSSIAVPFLQVLLDHYYQVEVEFQLCEPDLLTMLSSGDGALLIEKEAIQAYHQVKQQKILVTDLGKAWKQFTGEKMVYILWVVHREFAEANPEQTNNLIQMLYQAREWGISNLPVFITWVHQHTGLPVPVLENYFKTIRYEFGEEYQRGLLTFYDFAYKSGLIEERVKLKIWSKE